MKKLLLLLLLPLFPHNSYSQITYLADTGFVTDRGYGGAAASCLYKPGGYYLGWQMGRAQDTWIADDFTVPAGKTWLFDTVIVYGYQRGSGTGSTFLNCNLQIYKGTPGLGGTVVWGDTSTNVLVSTGFTGIYRVDTVAASGGLLNNTRPIMYLKLYLSPAPSLSAGTYWLCWSSAGSLSTAPDCPDKVLPGRINPTGQNARQLYGGKWYYVGDSGNTVGMDMIIKASEGLSADNVQPALKLNQNVPNPFSSSTKISFYLAESEYTTLSVYNSLGQLVCTLVSDKLNSGEHEVIFNTDKLPSGIYYYQLRTKAGMEQQKMVLLH